MRREFLIPAAKQPFFDGAVACPLQVCVLASGSRGNATYVSDGTTAVLIDAGLSGVEIQRRMAANGLSPNNLDAIIVSHEHTDHISGVGVLSRRFNLPVHINDATHQACETALGKLPAIFPFACGEPFAIGSLTLHPFSISHDAQDPAGFTLSGQGMKVGIATDLGVITEMIRVHLRGCHILVLEANHDSQMLMEGPYPWPLKQRIRGRCGHLSNEDTKNLVTDLFHDQLRHVVLAHLSEANNTPEKALETVTPALSNTRTRLHVATQTHGSQCLTIFSDLPSSALSDE
ncbi:MBL fold metallo-hydrolase [Desulfosarcina sp. OttesenSCG-928-A07]|nr:MBL fold metallo-hydrolase [Desulfosarcina sp. OttesenSCG-928-G17]MDL2328730.1 MBL fold metallo-hydrolase [Desulfosarcina sp. OttesenSCG-928-A07]